MIFFDMSENPGKKFLTTEKKTGNFSSRNIRLKMELGESVKKAGKVKVRLGGGGRGLGGAKPPLDNGGEKKVTPPRSQSSGSRCIGWEAENQNPDWLVFVSSTPTRVTWTEGTSHEELPPSDWDWPVGMSVRHLLD